MKKYSALLALALGLLFILSPVISTAASFIDVDGHWAEVYIKPATQLDWLAGYPDGTFRPNGNITNAEFVSLINRISKLEGIAEVKYADVGEKAWYYKDVVSAVANGYLYNEGKFNPDKPITREEVSRIIGNIYKLNEDLAQIGGFTDKDKIKDDAKSAVAALAKLGVIEGYPTGDFKPQNPIKRAEVIVILMKMFADHSDIFNIAGEGKKYGEILKRIREEYSKDPIDDDLIPIPEPIPREEPMASNPVSAEDKEVPYVSAVYWEPISAEFMLPGEEPQGFFTLKKADIMNGSSVVKYKIETADLDGIAYIDESTENSLIAPYSDKVKVYLYDTNGIQIGKTLIVAVKKVK